MEGTHELSDRAVTVTQVGDNTVVQVGDVILVNLPARQAEAIGHTLLGDTAKEAAARMGVSYRTVEAQLTMAMEKLGAKNRAHLVTRLRQEGILTTVGEVVAARESDT